jgi:putative restriction endonuclease
VRGYLFPTDFDWFTFLRARQPLDEVNFWRPSGRGFAALSPGEPLLFKLKSPHNAIGGFGIFARYEQATARLAWDAFGERNGATTFDEMCRRIEHYRSGQPSDPVRRYQVGCIMLSQPIFFADGDWVPQPADWAPQAVSGSGYDLSSGEGLRVWQQCLERAVSIRQFPPVAIAAEPFEEGDQAAGPRFGSPQVVLPRLGQGTFRVAVTGAYRGSCAVTGEHSMPVLEAAHIRPYEDEGQHTVSNGLLLRADVHPLFDRGYVTVSPDLKFVVSQRLKQEFANGAVYYEHHGKQIHLPSQVADRPSVELLRWHNENVFERGRAA